MSLNLHRDANLVMPLGLSTMLLEAENRKSLRGKGCMCPSGIFTSFLAFQSLRGTRQKFQFKGCVLLNFRTGFLNSHLPRHWQFFFGLLETDLNSQKPETRPVATHFNGCHSATWTECDWFRDRINESKRVTEGPAVSNSGPPKREVWCVTSWLAEASSSSKAEILSKETLSRSLT